ncbi:MAG: hypothetical protein IPK58_11900 [Acidobacteria bacterium]|nr:hypothetical protein [Acidobacteriota bacterium]
MTLGSSSPNTGPSRRRGGVKFYLQDWQGSVRAGLNAGGFVKSRTDNQAFGEPIEAGIGLRTTAQGFGAPASTRQGYGLTEKDSATGLNHTWFRKNENRAGRWTSPDPYNGSVSVGNPQSWNRYSYVENQPTNFVDPSGLTLQVYWTCYRSEYGRVCFVTAVFTWRQWIKLRRSWSRRRIINIRY